jgi:hypothetical protein
MAGFSTVAGAEPRAAVASTRAIRPALPRPGQLAGMSDCPALPPWPPTSLTPRPTPGRCALSTVERHGPPHGPRRGTSGRGCKSTDSGSGELLAGMSTLTNAPTDRRGWVTTGGCAEGVSIPGGNGSQLAGMSLHQGGTLVLGQPIAIGPPHRLPARGCGALDRGADAARRDRLRLVLRYFLTRLCVCDPAPLWMTAKTKSITRDLARLWVDICRAPLATSGGRP